MRYPEQKTSLVLGPPSPSKPRVREGRWRRPQERLRLPAMIPLVVPQTQAALQKTSAPSAHRTNRVRGRNLRSRPLSARSRRHKSDKPPRAHPRHLLLVAVCTSPGFRVVLQSRYTPRCVASGANSSERTMQSETKVRPTTGHVALIRWLPQQQGCPDESQERGRRRMVLNCAPAAPGRRRRDNLLAPLRQGGRRHTVGDEVHG